MIEPTKPPQGGERRSGRMAGAINSLCNIGLRDKRVKTVVHGEQNLSEYHDAIDVKMLETTPSFAKHTDIETQVSALLNNRDWLVLGEHLADWDNTRAACPSQRRVIHTAIDCMTDALRLLKKVRAELAIVSDEDPGLYPLRTALAQIYLSKAWDVRDRRPDLSRAHVDRALALTADLDAKELGSPLVAAVHFNLLPLMDAPYDHLLRAYETRVHLDPGDVASHFSLSRMIPAELPDRAERVELCGRQAVAWTHKRFGATAYAAIYLGEMQQRLRALSALDLELLEEGLDDLILYRRRDPVRVAEVFQTLRSFASTEASATLPARRKEIGRMAQDFLRKHLTAIFPDAWDLGTEGALDAIAQTMQADLKNGYGVTVSDKGLGRAKKKGA